MTWRAWASAGIAACVLVTSPVHAQAVSGLEPRAGAPLRDPDFGVQVRGFGLDRRVEMLQWQRVEGQYRRVWHDAPLDARTHDAAHANPRIPVRSRRWWSDSARINARPIDSAVLQALGTWKTMRPDFAALPGTLAATYQPEGDGLGSADNPLEPRIGDVRITWRRLLLPPLDGRVELVRGTWRLRDAATIAVAPSPLDLLPPPDPAPEPAPRVSQRGTPDPTPRWPWIVAALALVIAAWPISRRRRRRR